jgi:DNA polymerase III delta prime subunit
MLNENPSLIYSKNSNNDIPLHIACKHGNVKLVSELLKRGSSLNCVNNKNETPLKIAIDNGWMRCVDIINSHFKKTFKILSRHQQLPYQPLTLPSLPQVPQRQFPQIPQFNEFNPNDDKPSQTELGLKEQISSSKIPENYKIQAITKEKGLLLNFGPSASKDKEWIETLLKIPFDTYSTLQVNKESTIETIKEYFKSVTNTLEEASYGMENVKEEVIDYISQMISTNGNAMPRVICIQGVQGSGKCLAKGTKVLMFDGNLKNVEDIQVGDVIMGDDSTPRNILALGRGKDKLYRIDDVKGETYTVNSEHILTLIYAHSKIILDDKKDNRYRVRWFDKNKISIVSKNFSYKNDIKEEVYKDAKEFLDSIIEDKICDISIKDYLSLQKTLKADLKGLYTGVDFKEKELDFDPYILGLWLGDGHHADTSITNQDSSIIKYLKENLGKYNCYLQYSNKYDYRINSCDTSRKEGVNYMMNILRKHNLIKNKHIPYIYKCNSRENRLKLLAGLIDSDGSLDNACFEISQSIEHEKLLDDIQYLCRSLGFSCIKSKKITSWTYKGIKNKGVAWRLSISGYGLNEVPTLVPRKKANERRQIKNALVSGITVTPLGYDDYYGFEIDGNRRFVLGNFIITHNTSLVRNGISKVLNRPFQQINMGGITDADYLIGHDSTYVGSKPGRIVQALINSKVMNPIIFMDEVDKISSTEKGNDIQSVLIHLTDPIQNKDFQDKYFSGLNIDVSKAVFIFSCNDENKLSPILKDRLNIIKIKEPSIQDKTVIGKKYLLKELVCNVGLSFENIKLEDDVVKHIINSYCKDDVGVRGLKKCIESILMKINSARYSVSKYKTLKNLNVDDKTTVEITIKMIDDILVKKEDKRSELMNSMFL